MAEPKAPSSQKDVFFPIKDNAVIVRLLDIAAKHKIDFTLWFQNNPLRFESNVSSFMQHLKRLYFRFPAELDETQSQDLCAVPDGTQILGSFQVETIHFFFRTTILDVNKDGLRIAIPEIIFKVQRRANLRIYFPRKQAPRLTLFNPAKTYDPDKDIHEADLLPYRVLDLSAGGLAFAATPAEASLFPAGKIVHDVHFKIRGRGITTKGLIRNVRESLNDQGKPMLRVGIQFTGLKPEFEKLIVLFVLDESRNMFSLLH